MIDTSDIKDSRKLLQDLYERLCNVKAELEKKVESADYFYPTQESALDRRELDAVSSIIKYIENYDKK